MRTHSNPNPPLSVDDLHFSSDLAVLYLLSSAVDVAEGVLSASYPAHCCPRDFSPSQALARAMLPLLAVLARLLAEYRAQVAADRSDAEGF